MGKPLVFHRFNREAGQGICPTRVWYSSLVYAGMYPSWYTPYLASPGIHCLSPATVHGYGGQHCWYGPTALTRAVTEQ